MYLSLSTIPALLFLFMFLLTERAAVVNADTISCNEKYGMPDVHHCQALLDKIYQLDPVEELEKKSMKHCGLQLTAGTYPPSLAPKLPFSTPPSPSRRPFVLHPPPLPILPPLSPAEPSCSFLKSYLTFYGLDRTLYHHHRLFQVLGPHDDAMGNLQARDECGVSLYGAASVSRRGGKNR